MRSERSALVLAGIFGLALAAGSGCKKKAEESTSGGTTTPSTLSQEQIDDQTANNIINAVIDIYNQNVAGRSQSQYNNVTVNCPNGGTALIQGIATKPSNSNLTTTDLKYTMSGCRVTKTNHDFTYNGVLTEKGTFDISSNFVSETLQSVGNVSMAGTITVSGFNNATVNESASFTINRGFNTASGSIGGRSFSY